MTELVKFDKTSKLPTEYVDRFKEEAKENLEGVQPRLPKVQMPTGRGKEFSIESFTADPEETKELKGIIIYQSAANAYWASAYEGGTAVVPDCASHDGVKPSEQYDEVQSPDCATCQHNRFGSARDPEGNKLPGKACRNVKRVALVRLDDPTIPVLLIIPPSSIKAFDDFMVVLAKAERPYYSVVTTVTVSTEQNRSGIDFPHLNLDIAGYINDKENLDKVITMREQWNSMIKSSMFVSEDVQPNPSNGGSFSQETTTATKAPEF
jgi:hypothetical protein